MALIIIHKHKKLKDIISLQTEKNNLQSWLCEIRRLMAKSKV